MASVTVEAAVACRLLTVERTVRRPRRSLAARLRRLTLAFAGAVLGIGAVVPLDLFPAAVGLLIDVTVVAVIEDTTASVRGGMDFSGFGGTPLEKLANLSRSVIERTVSPLAVQMYRLVSSLSDRHPELVRTFFERGPSRTRVKIPDYLRDNFADRLWTEDFMEAGDDLVGFATAHFHFQSLWGIASPPMAKQKDARARLAATLFLRAYGRDPDALAPIGEQHEEEEVLARTG